MTIGIPDVDILKNVCKKCLEGDGYKVFLDISLDKKLRWRPNIYAIKSKERIALEIRLNEEISRFWGNTIIITKKLIPGIKIFFVIPEEMKPSYDFGLKIHELGIGLIRIEEETLAVNIDPEKTSIYKSEEIIKKTKKFHIDRSDLKDLGKYFEPVCDAIDIYEIGHSREAVGAIGRVLEEAINDFLVIANKKHKINISISRLEGMDFDTKINFLRSDKNLSNDKKRNIEETEKVKMLSVKWDRHSGSHPRNKKEIEALLVYARSTMETGINMIRLLINKIRRNSFYE